MLIRCQAGINRSGLVTALVLILDGHSAGEAIAMLRRRRSPFALCNDAFVDWLLVDAETSLRTATAEDEMRHDSRALGRRVQ